MIELQAGKDLFIRPALAQQLREIQTEEKRMENEEKHLLVRKLLP